MAKATTENNGSSADKLRNNMDRWVQTRCPLNLFFLEYISDAFENQSSPTLLILMIDTVRLNNDLLQQWERDCFLFQETRNPVTNHMQMLAIKRWLSMPRHSMNHIQG
ncbi:hypothetical protein SAMN05216428_11651 [Nitrosospira sp. Nsp11]|uniref:hypothetical protein n=1 Tax=Nitrosospira sp. Nsp11 TaxID=1855338 RepID=UPI00091122FD|nr:hypothetical protein [Nitrosospira sp. Nsp11]SHM18731.1 hypothetical protein SAMN05216428_11651 [Nitrosospira sp. Nsp11]